MSVPSHVCPDCDGSGRQSHSPSAKVNAARMQDKVESSDLRSHERERDDVTKNVSAAIFQPAQKSLEAPNGPRTLDECGEDSR